MSAEARGPDEASGRTALHARIAALIARLGQGGRDDAARDALLEQLCRWQRARLPVYDRLVTRLGAPAGGPSQWPALPTDVFRFARVACHPEAQDSRVFRSSGTSAARRGSHCFKDLSLYDLAAERWARYALFPDVARMQLVVLAPSSAELTDSSLSYMLDRFGAWFGEGPSVQVVAGGALDAALLERTLAEAERSQTPLALLGTSFAFVHAEDALGARRFALAAGSRIMQTGGFKGRSREVEPRALLSLLALRYGIDPRYIVQEYGMTELSSQLYESTLREAALGRSETPRRLLVPGWVRVTPLDAETLAKLPEPAEGVLRIDDLANLDSVCALQTSDRGRRLDDGVLVLGRAAGAEPRGCSLALDAALGG